MTDTADQTRRQDRRPRAWDGEALRAQFATAALERPWTLGYQNVDSEVLQADLELEGALPSNLKGTLFRNGPARHELGGQRYAHRWDGDGMLQAFHMADGRITHRGRYVETIKHLTETRRGNFLATTFGTAVPGSGTDAASLEHANPANIHVVRFGRELLALWEAGPAHRVKPSTLDTLGTCCWSEPLRGAPFSAHPKPESDGMLWNFGVDPISERLILYLVHPDRGLIQSHVLSVPDIAPVHDFCVTSRHLVFLLPSIRLDKARLQAGMSFGESCQWLPRQAMRVLVIDKNDFEMQEMELPPGCLFHVARAAEDEVGNVVVDYMRADNPMSLMAGWTVMRGQYRHAPGARLTRAVLEIQTGRTSQHLLGDLDSEFPVALDVGDMKSSAKILCLERSPSRPFDLPGFDQVACIDLSGARRQSYSYGDDWLVEEHVAAPSGLGQASWIVGTALNMRHQKTAISIFAASDLTSGPVARGWLPYALPLGLHGSFLP